MKFDFWNRVLVSSIFVVLLVGLVSAVYYSMTWAGRYTAVGLWTIINFWLLGKLLSLIVKKSSVIFIGFLLIVKIPVWYTLGFFILKYLGVEPTSLLAGLNTVFVVLILKSLGKQIADKNRESGVRNQESGIG